MAPLGLERWAQAHVAMSCEQIKVPPPRKDDSQSQCSVHKLPWCPSLPGRLRQSNTVGYSRHGYLGVVDREMKHQRKRSPVSESFKILGNIQYLSTSAAESYYISCFSVFLLRNIYRQKASCQTKSLILCHVPFYKFCPSSGNNNWKEKVKKVDRNKVQKWSHTQKDIFGL